MKDQGPRYQILHTQAGYIVFSVCYFQVRGKIVGLCTVLWNCKNELLIFSITVYNSQVQVEDISTGIIWLRTGTCGRLFWTW